MACWTCLLAVMLAIVSEDEPGHSANPVYKPLLAGDFRIGDEPIEFPAPTFRDGQSADEQREALGRVAGSPSKAGELLRDSVTAPFILKVRDAGREGGDVVRAADLWFVVHADLDAIDLGEAGGVVSKGGPVEAGNMRFETKEVADEQLRERGIRVEAGEDTRREWYVHVSGRLLDRIQVEATDRAVATRAGDSIVVASRTVGEFGQEGPLGNRWWPIQKGGDRPEAERYAGGAGYVKISRYRPEPGALVVEAHFAFAEPKAWFNGAPILRSKLGLIAQDRIRGLRRELADRRKSGAG